MSATIPVSKLVDPDAYGVLGDVLRTAARRPDLVALIDNGRCISYAELAARVHMAAVTLGPRCGRVAVQTTRSADTVIALLGVLAAGGVYCPIDPAHPAERQQRLLQRAGCNTFLRTRTTGPLPPLPVGIRVIALSAEGLVTGAAHPSLGAAAEEAPCYLLFTSGSTGEPKGVLNSHGALTSAARGLQQVLRLRETDRMLQFASLNWDTCFEEIFPTLSAGAALVFDDDAHSGSHARLLRMLKSREVSVLNLPTAYWHELVHHLRDSGDALPPMLHTVVIGGEAASCARIADWCALGHEHIRLVNTYGSTETSLVTHAAELHGPYAAAPQPPWAQAVQAPIGKALAHVDERLSEDGELWIGGPSLALGYLDMPDLTAGRFVMSDLGDGPRRYYRTGDRVQRRSDGTLVHAGRLDHQIKVRGMLVDPAEVEAEILKCPEVDLAAVVGVRSSERSHVIAYVVPRQGAVGATLIASLLQDLRSRVPEHLVPSQVRVVSALVYTSSGKVDRASSHRVLNPQFQSTSVS